VSKADELYRVWILKREEWERKLKSVGSVSEEDVNEFLRLVGNSGKSWQSYDLGDFLSLVLKYCYNGKVIELDVNLVEGEIDVGRNLNKDLVIYVKGEVVGNIGGFMENGVVIVECPVMFNVGYYMKGGFIIIDNLVVGSVGTYMEGGVIYVGGDVNNCVGESMKGGFIYIKGNVKMFVGNNIHGGVIYVGGNANSMVGWTSNGGIIVVDGELKETDHEWMDWIGKGFVVNKGFVYTSRGGMFND